MKLMTLILTVILTATPPLAWAQTDDLRSSWHCYNPTNDNPPSALRCSAACFEKSTNVLLYDEAEIFSCTQEHVPQGQPLYDFHCMDYAEAFIPVQCVRPSSGQSSSSNSTNKALIAGGVVVAGVALWNFLQPEIPVEGLEIQPKANFAYRDGFPSSSFSLQGEYGNWAFSASTAHTGQEWTKPYARVKWAWVF